MNDASCAVLITGFGPFPGVPHNVSAALAAEIGAEVRARFPWSNVVSAALPTEWAVAPEQVSDLIGGLKPALAVHFGVSDIARGFVIETVARNVSDRLDASGALPAFPVVEPFGPEMVPTLLPAGRINARLRRLGLPARLSRDAGSYLCNAVFYRSVLTQTELGLGGRSGFVHLPVAVRNAPGTMSRHRGRRAVDLDFERAKRGGVEIISACLNK